MRKAATRRSSAGSYPHRSRESSLDKGVYELKVFESVRPLVVLFDVTTLRKSSQLD